MKNKFPHFIIVFTSLIFWACPKDEPQIAECDTGYLPCEDENSECCDVICDDGYHLCGEDSTECCLDTTSHNYIWRVDTVGNRGTFFDITIIDENNIIAVGEVYSDSDKYFNAAHFDGEQWTLLDFESFNGIGMVTQVLYSISYFGENDIWALGTIPIYYDGESWTQYHLEQMGIVQGAMSREMWGVSSSDIYFTGYSGRLVHYDGSTFTKIPAGTDKDLDNITGFYNLETDTEIIWIASWGAGPGRGVLLKYNETDINAIWTENDPFYEDPQYLDPTVWVSPNNSLVLYVGGSDHGIITHHNISDFSIYDTKYYNYDGFLIDIDGNSVNDYFLVGHFGNVIHFNGSTYYRYENFSGYAQLQEVSVKDNTVAIVGNGNKIIIGSKL